MTTDTRDMPETIAAWHRVVEAADPTLLDALLADDCVFRSPAVHTPQEGKQVTTAYLSAAMVVLGPTLSYRREWYADDSAVLQFAAELDGPNGKRISVDGIDMITWGEDGRITEFAVMVRPVKALHKLMELMAAELFRDRG
ncbi:nuclear transport factor 2 family protein [Nocardioides dilutus]